MLAFYRFLLRLYPRAFQEEYGKEMTVAFRDRCANEGGVLLLISTIADTVVTAAGVHAEMLGQDLRYGLRALRKDRAFSIAGIATLALGIGATTAMFSVAYAVLLRPLPYADADRLVRVHDTNPTLRIETFANSVPNLIDWQQRTKAFEALAGFRFLDLTVTEGSGAERVEGIAVLGPFWQAIGQKMILGRAFLPHEETEGNDKVIILGESFWERRFARDPSVIGRSLSVGGVSRMIVGIAPSDLGLGTAVEIFGPFSEGPASNRGDRQVSVVGRLKPGVGMAQANQELDLIAAQLEREYPKANEGWRTRLTPIRDWILEPQFQRAMYVLLGAVGLLLAIASVNVANLLIARSAAREREFGARLALGASKSRLARQLITESLLLGLLGGLAGVVLAWVFLRVLSPFLPTFAAHVELNWQVLSFAFVVTVAVSLLFGLGPALAGTRGDIRSVLQASTRGESAAYSGSRSILRRALVVSQVALAAILLIGALLLTVSFTRMVQQDFGFGPDHLLAARFSPPPGKFKNSDQWVRYMDSILAEMRSLPGVKSAAMTSEIPFGPVDTQQGVIAEERAASIRTDGVQSSWRLVSSDYLSTMGVRLLKGRVWSANEDYKIRPILISQDLASRLWPDGQDPIGRQVRMSNTRTFTVIGVAANVRHRTMTDSEPTNTIYWPASLFNWDTMTIVLRTQGNPSAMVSAMREAMRRVDPMQPLFEVSTVDDFVANTASAPRLAALLLGLFAGLALLLAVVGVAGLTAYAVARRRSELAIRLALGATGMRVIKDVTSEQFRLCAAGVLVGVIAAWWLRPLVASMLFGVEAGHVPAYAGAGALLLLSGLLACLSPAIRIAGIDPASALRND